MQKRERPIKDSITIVTRLMRQQDSNLAGFVHGGTLLKMVDTVAYICASRHSKKRCVTASIDKVNFWKPINIGELVTLYASVNYVGKTSMEIGVRVEAEDIITGKKIHTNSCYVTMVALDKKGKPTTVPKILPKTPDEKRRYRQAEYRRKFRVKHMGKD